MCGSSLKESVRGNGLKHSVQTVRNEGAQRREKECAPAKTAAGRTRAYTHARIARRALAAPTPRPVPPRIPRYPPCAAICFILVHVYTPNAIVEST